MEHSDKSLKEIAEGYVKLIREATSADEALYLMREFGEKAHSRGWNSALRTIASIAETKIVN